MRIRQYNESDRESWDAYVMGISRSDCYHLTGWKNVIEKSFGHKALYLLSEDDTGNINGILPMINLKSFLFGNFLVSVPYLNYGGICANDNETCSRLVDKAIEAAKSAGAAHIELRQTNEIQGELPVKTSKVAMRLNLPENSEQLFNSYPSKLRSQIRRPSKEGMQSRFGREGELDSFYKVFSINMRDLGTPVYSKDFFRNILTEFPESTWICSVYSKEGVPVASGFLIGFKDTLEIVWASSLREFNRYSPNMLLYWSVLEFACGKGFKVFDFGRSTKDEATYKFKEQWGAKPVQLYWHYWVSNGKSMPELNPKNPKYSAAIKIWQKLPVAVTRIIGPAIVKNLP